MTVAALALAAPNSAADLGDLTYDPSLLHRVTIQFAGNAPGTGSNTATGATSTAAVPMQNPLSLVFDFYPVKEVDPLEALIRERMRDRPGAEPLAPEGDPIGELGSPDEARWGKTSDELCRELHTRPQGGPAGRARSENGTLAHDRP